MKDHFGCQVALKSPAHITLIAPFWLKQKREDEMVKAISTFSAPVNKPKILLDGFSHFGRRVIFVAVKENPVLTELRKIVEQYFIKLFGDIIKKEIREFHPHITIANRDLSPSVFVKSWKYFSDKIFTESFIANDISLLKLTDGKWTVIATKEWSQ
ncbi:MAG TPA: 2'-5' RNA ligase family protein [Chitinophagaceae bacterium]|nr:2'-5' RNA ligase family protein [Chitinophagaceae bacterium]